MKSFRFQYSRELDRFLLLLLSADCFLIIIHILYYYTGFLSNEYYAIWTDKGFAESFQYIKEFWIVLMFFIFALRKSKFLYFNWAAVFGYMLLDDCGEIHEKLGFKISSYLASVPPFGLRTQDIGELAVFIIFGFVLLLPLLVCFYMSDENERMVSKYLFAMLIAFGVFGIFFDMLNMIIVGMRSSPFLEQITAVIEDGGEMIIMSIILWFVFSLSSFNGNIQHFYFKLPYMRKQDP